MTKAKYEEVDEEYGRQVRAVEGLVVAMLAVSDACAGRLARHSRIAWASVLFTRLTGLSISLERLLPLSRWDSRKHDGVIWDFSAIATLSRAVLECDLMLFYLGLEATSDGEWSARLDLCHLHDATARADMLRTLFKDDEEAKKVWVQRDELVARLKASEWFSALPARQQAHFLRGGDTRFEIQDAVIARMGRDVDEFRSWFRVLSAHTHSFPLSFNRLLIDERGKGLENPIDKAWMASTLAYVCTFLRPSTERYLALFPDVSDPRLRGRAKTSNLPVGSPLRRDSWA